LCTSDPKRSGAPLDTAKIVYGQSFAIYAFSEHAYATGDTTSLELATRTLELLETQAADPVHGGYVENFTADWQRAAGGFGGGDRKGLDTHMHLMESVTALCRASGSEAHRVKLKQLIELIARHMIDTSSGCGLNQFDLAWNSVEAIALDRTWNAERAGERPTQPLDTTSYGHNLELAWLMRDALQVAGIPFERYRDVYRRLVDHALLHGLDPDFGGLYRDGLRDGAAVVLEKEFWQQAEGLLGFVDAYVVLQAECYLVAATSVWSFVERHMLVSGLGEWRVLVDRQGRPIDSSVGNPWKVSYHTGRALLESVERLAP
jgi:mannobiose 2-epimerase